jgi:protein-arginine kinase activator protein McsA
MPTKLTQEEFLDRCYDTHGDLYDYSKLVYVNSGTKVEIICKVHGSFWQRANTHIMGHGCNVCKLDDKRFTQEEFLDICYAKHGDLYDYSKLVYIGAHFKIEIICKVHGSFWQVANSHIMGHGCNLCKYDGRRYTQEEFLDRCYAKHGDLYDYSKVVYIGGDYKVEIICKAHGSFWQVANYHIMGHGCPVCSNATRVIVSNRLYAEKPTIVYYVQVVDPCGDYWKVGITRKGLSKRFGKTTFDNHINVVWTYEFDFGEPAWMFEQFILNKFNDHRVYNPDISVISSGLTEIFGDDVASDKDSLYAEYMMYEEADY